jgi:GT2 family glycosyltransferase
LVLTQDPPADEVLVIDQTPRHDTDTTAFLRCQARAGAIRWIRQHPPNLPAARNRGLRETDCDIVLFLDDDVIPEPGLVEYHRLNYASPSIDAVAGRIVGLVPTPRRQATSPPTPHLEFRNFDFASTRRRESVAALQGANHSVRRATALALGGYDENYLGWAYREETDLALRLYRSGRQTVFDPLAAVIHLAAPSGGCRLSGFRRALQQWKVSFPAHYFAWKHLFPGVLFWAELGVDFRRAVLSRRNILAPYRLPAALASFAFSLLYSCWRWLRCR